MTRLYRYKVSGGSPGHNGIIVVLAKTRQTANRLALEEVRNMNIRRRVVMGHDCDEISVDVKEVDIYPFKGVQGVVYSFDGEA